MSASRARLGVKLEIGPKMKTWIQNLWDAPAKYKSRHPFLTLYHHHLPRALAFIPVVIILSVDWDFLIVVLSSPSGLGLHPWVLYPPHAIGVLTGLAKRQRPSLSLRDPFLVGQDRLRWLGLLWFWGLGVAADRELKPFHGGKQGWVTLTTTPKPQTTAGLSIPFSDTLWAGVSPTPTDRWTRTPTAVKDAADGGRVRGFVPTPWKNRLFTGTHRTPPNSSKQGHSWGGARLRRSPRRNLVGWSGPGFAGPGVWGAAGIGFWG
ncbi:hypothetical protein BJY52DRAFT_1231722 [Lactarius psammicola]|nr:hypothetical protein BJY52DRAFT_1231722 [Lactarius psammicola]